MRDETRQKRHEAIAAVAYDLLAQKGYDGASMLSIAKAAKASNETLYRWYGDKRGLFEALVRDNAARVEAELTRAAGAGASPMETLERIAPVLLAMLLGERAILLNRAAAAEPSGELGTALSAGGRDAIQPLLMEVIVQLDSKAPAAMLTQAFVGLLIGDQQIKRVIGVMPEPSADEIMQRVGMAMTAFAKLVD